MSEPEESGKPPTTQEDEDAFWGPGDPLIRAITEELTERFSDASVDGLVIDEFQARYIAYAIVRRLDSMGGI